MMGQVAVSPGLSYVRKVAHFQVLRLSGAYLIRTFALVQLLILLWGTYSRPAFDLRSVVAFYYIGHVMSQHISPYFTWDKSLLV